MAKTTNVVWVIGPQLCPHCLLGAFTSALRAVHLDHCLNRLVDSLTAFFGGTHHWNSMMGETSLTKASQGSVGTDVFLWNVTPFCPQLHCEYKCQPVCHLWAKSLLTQRARETTWDVRQNYLYWVMTEYNLPLLTCVVSGIHTGYSRDLSSASCVKQTTFPL